MEDRLKKIIKEELTKTEVKNIVSSAIDSNLNSREFNAKVKEITVKVMEELYKLMWTRKSFWSDSIKK